MSAEERRGIPIVRHTGLNAWFKAAGEAVRQMPVSWLALLLTAAVTGAFLSWRRLAGEQLGAQTCAALAALTVLIFIGVDWVLLAALPPLGLSYAPLRPALAATTAVRMVALALILIVLAIVWPLIGTGWAQIGLGALWLANLGMSAALAYGMYVEPFALQTSRFQLAGPALQPGRPLRILHLTDLHVERLTRRERQVLAQAKALAPDLILLTGDYPNLDHMDEPQTRRDTRTVLAGLSAPLGVYAVSGSIDSPEFLQEVFDGLPITLLHDEVQRLELPGREIYLVGVSNQDRAQDARQLQHLMSQVPAGAYNILLYHTPDLAEAASQSGVNLYLAGHTHGGQVRLPLYGALITMSAYGKRFESGLFQVGQMRLFVSRGIGLEGLGLPRARFLCPPEITLIELSQGGDG